MANAGAKLSSFPEVNDIQTGDMFPLLSGGNTNAKIDYATLANAITADETTRAKAAEEANANAISAETTRAKAAEEANANAISAETTRAKAAEEALTEKLQNYGLKEQLLRDLPHGYWNTPKWVRLFTFDGIGDRVQQYVTIFYTDDNYGDYQFPKLASILGYNSTDPQCLTRDLINATTVSNELGYVVNSDGKTEVYMLLKNYAVPSVGFFIACNVTIDCQTLVYDEPEGIKYF